jgi:quinoprotein glucose dehydrogenase/quinate dehydrogenase (quinone)
VNGKYKITSWAGCALFVVPGLLLLVGGIHLAALGGSPFYGFAGAILLVTGALIAIRSRIAGLSHAALLAIALAWSIYETGFDCWALASRIGVFVALGLWFAIPRARSALLPGSKPSWRLCVNASPALVVLSVLLLVATYERQRFAPVANSASTGGPAPSQPVAQSEDWPLYGNTARGDRFSPADLITPANADHLELAWMFRTGDALRNGEPAAKTVTSEATPIKVGDALFVCTPHDVLFSLEADTGKERWRFDPHAETTNAMHMVCRGVSYVPGEGTGGVCDGRILMATLDNRLMAVDAASGKLCPDFGAGGTVDLTAGMGTNAVGYYYPTSPPVIVGHVAVLGNFHMDNQSNDEPPGVVRAFDTRSGALLWAWEVLEPTSRQALLPGETFVRDTANAWTVFSADAENGLVFVPTGGPPPDYFGGGRTKAQDRYNDSIVALDVKTGAVRWSFQISHHDVWDMDIASQPVVVDLDTPRGRKQALIVPTKRGEIFTLDRITGEPLYPVEERPVPQTHVQGERLSPTQPYTVGVPSFSPPHLAEADMWGATIFDQMLCRIEFRKRHYEGQFTAPSLEGSIGYPDIFGVFNWGSVAVDPERQLMFLNPTWLPYLTKLIPRSEADAQGIVPFGTKTNSKASPVGLHASGYIFPQAGTPYASSAGPFLSRFGFPCHRPPWGEVAVVDLKTEQVLWRRPFGTTRDAAPFGIALPMGVFSLGGAVITRGGVAFIGAAIDDYLRAFDVYTGAEVWKARLPAGGQATPMSYVSQRTGRQYVVIVAGGHAAMKTKQGDYVVAYALRDGAR